MSLEIVTIPFTTPAIIREQQSQEGKMSFRASTNSVSAYRLLCVTLLVHWTRPIRSDTSTTAVTSSFSITGTSYVITATPVTKTNIDLKNTPTEKTSHVIETNAVITTASNLVTSSHGFITSTPTTSTIMANTGTPNTTISIASTSEPVQNVYDTISNSTRMTNTSTQITRIFSTNSSTPTTSTIMANTRTPNTSTSIASTSEPVPNVYDIISNSTRMANTSTQITRTNSRYSIRSTPVINTHSVIVNDSTQVTIPHTLSTNIRKTNSQSSPTRSTFKQNSSILSQPTTTVPSTAETTDQVINVTCPSKTITIVSHNRNGTGLVIISLSATLSAVMFLVCLKEAVEYYWKKRKLRHGLDISHEEDTKTVIQMDNLGANFDENLSLNGDAIFQCGRFAYINKLDDIEPGEAVYTFRKPTTTL